MRAWSPINLQADVQRFNRRNTLDHETQQPNTNISGFQSLLRDALGDSIGPECLRRKAPAFESYGVIGVSGRGDFVIDNSPGPAILLGQKKGGLNFLYTGFEMQNIAQVNQEHDSRDNVRRKKPVKVSSNVQIPYVHCSEKITSGLRGKNCVAKHSSIIQWMELFHPMKQRQNVQRLLGLQKLHGNRFVQRIVAYQAIQKIQRQLENEEKREPVQIESLSAQKTGPVQMKSKDKETTDQECQGSTIRIEVRKSQDLSNTFTSDPSIPILPQAGAQIYVPNSATKVSQDELLDATLNWSCPGGTRDTENGKHILSWSQEGSELKTVSNEKVAIDGHLYGLRVKPSSDLRESAETKGFNMDACTWDLVENFQATTSANLKRKTLHRCTWGFTFRAQHVVEQDGSVTKAASVSYHGVDLEIEV